MTVFFVLPSKTKTSLPISGKPASLALSTSKNAYKGSISPLASLTKNKGEIAGFISSRSKSTFFMEGVAPIKRIPLTPCRLDSTCHNV